MTDLYKPNQLGKTVPYLGFAPKWFIVCGVGVGGEALAARKVWPRCRIVGLEPAPAAHALMNRSGMFPGTLVNAAAWLRTTRLFLWSGDTALYGNLFNLAADFGPDGTTQVRPGNAGPPVVVDAVTLDDLSIEIGPFDEDVFLWMDVEYAEVAVLIGARRLLESGAVRAVNFENHPVTVCPGKSLIVRDILAQHGLTKVLEYENEGAHHWDELWVGRTGGSV